jgi:Domain of unknown function (DUF4184)
MPGYRLFSRFHVFSAAVIGSMVPDFGLLLPRYPARPETHSALALFTFCLPVGLVTYWLTQLLIKPAVLEVLPDRAYQRLRVAHPSAPLTQLRTWLQVSGALLIGAATHLIWDAFTHENALGVRTFPFLKYYGPGLEGHPLHLWRWFQFGSSVIGLLVVIAAVIAWIHHAPTLGAPPVRVLGRRERWTWIALYLVPPLLGLGAWISRLAGGVAQLPTGWGVGGMAVESIRGAAISLILVSAMLKARLRVR